jgi:glycosyltransferase involved in cell wall biosynthesis
VGDDIGRDFETLVRAFDGLDIPLLVKSSRPLPEPLPPNVRVLGEHIGFEALRDLYAHARLVALPLHDTLHPSGINSLLESMAMRRPVIVTDSQGVADYVENGATALVTPCGDAAALRSAVVSLWNDQARRERLGAAARRFCESHCGMPYYMRQVSTVIREAIAGARGL